MTDAFHRWRDGGVLGESGGPQRGHVIDSDFDGTSFWRASSSLFMYPRSIQPQRNPPSPRLHLAQSHKSASARLATCHQDCLSMADLNMRGGS
jgi:hypothetical protein